MIAHQALLDLRHADTPAIVPVFGALTVHFLPEPGVFSLLASGALVLGLLGWRRRR